MDIKRSGSQPSGKGPADQIMSTVDLQIARPGTTKLSRLEENIASAAIDLAPDDLRSLENAVSQIAVTGDRYPPAEAERTQR
jgi:hypothetical protein